VLKPHLSVPVSSWDPDRSMSEEIKLKELLIEDMSAKDIGLCKIRLLVIVIKLLRFS